MKQIVDVLEHYLAEAKKNSYHAIAVTMVNESGGFYGGHSGHVTAEYRLLEGVIQSEARLRQSIENWNLPPRNTLLDASYFVYSMLTSPLGFDYLVWLINAEMTRKRYRAPGPLKVCFWEGNDPDAIHGREGRAAYLDNVLRPLLKMIGGIEIKDPHGWYKDSYLIKEAVIAARDGEEIPKLKATKRSLFPGYITITLREAEHWPERNSRLDSWFLFARYLQRNERVVIVRDTCKADKPFNGLQTCPEASRNIDDRMALYAEAKMNFFVSNGPVSLCVFSDAPWMQFISVADAADFWSRTAGLDPGQQYPWSRWNQKIIWKPDLYENLVEAWDQKLANVA